MEKINVSVKKLPHAAGLPLPAYMTENAAGVDLVAAVDDCVVILPGARGLIPTGLQIAVPPGYEVQIRPRSGLALNRGISVPNSPGTIDSDYRGEVKIILANLGEEPFIVSRGDRIAQMVIARIVHAEIREENELSDTERGEGGFGHTGI